MIDNEITKLVLNQGGTDKSGNSKNDTVNTMKNILVERCDGFIEGLRSSVDRISPHASVLVQSETATTRILVKFFSNGIQGICVSYIMKWKWMSSSDLTASPSML